MPCRSRLRIRADVPPNDFPPICAEPGQFFDRIRELYLYEERPLLDSIRRGDRREATRIINLLLVHIYSEGAERSELLKGLLLELIVMMSRAAVEAGASQSEVLGLGFRHLTELAGIEDDEHLAAWLRMCVLRIFDAVESRQSPPVDPAVARVLALIRERAGGPVVREEIARMAGLSPSRMAEVLRLRTGRSFSTLLREARVERACGMLRESAAPVAEIAAACGFCDQSHFTHVFQDAKKMTPRQYRDAAPGLRKTQKNPL